MARLPIPGSDENVWGDVLNDFLKVEHNTDGTLKKAAEIAAKYTKPATGIPKADLSSAVQTSLDKADTAEASANTYTDTAVAGVQLATVSDVSIVEPIENEVLGYSASLSKWTNRPLPAGAGTGNAVEIYQNSDNSWPLRSTITSDSTISVMWIGNMTDITTAPAGNGYALPGDRYFKRAP